MQHSNPHYFCWVVAYITAEYIAKVEKELKRYPEYSEVEAYIPTVKILKKTFKKENYFEEVPLLFNYGFFKIPRKYAVHQNFLDQMQKNISCIFYWVKDPVKSVESLKQTDEYTDKYIPIATATSQEIADLVKSASTNSLYGGDEIDRLKPGVTITLRGYPFDNMQAEIVEIYPKKSKALVNIKMFEMSRPAMVTFDNIFFTIYHNDSNHNEDSNKDDSLDEFAEKKSLDKKLYKYGNRD